MKSTQVVHHHRLHKYSWTGYLFGGILLLVSIVDLYVLETPLYHKQAAYMTLIPGIALVLRAHRPPIGMIRGISLILGGATLGILPLIITSTEDSRILWAAVAGGLIGAALLGLGFSPKPEKMHHE